MLLPFLLVGLPATLVWASSLDMLLSGEEEAQTLGLDVARVQRWGVTWAAVLTAGAVAVGGTVSFVGLVVPHALRPLVGVKHRGLDPRGRPRRRDLPCHLRHVGAGTSGPRGDSPRGRHGG